MNSFHSCFIGIFEFLWRLDVVNFYLKKSKRVSNKLKPLKQELLKKELPDILVMRDDKIILQRENLKDK